MDTVLRMKRVIPAAALFGAAVFVSYRVWKTRARKTETIKASLKFRNKSEREIIIVSTIEEWEQVYTKLIEKCRTIKAVGFDCEWVYWGKRLPVALIQLATHDGFCVLVRIFKMDSVPITLKQFLGDRSILKIGVASKDDAKKLMKDYGIYVEGCVDLRHIITRVPGFKYYSFSPSMSLAALAYSVVDVTMVKDRSIRCGNWEAEILSQEQLDYAANDGLIAIDIFMQLMTMKVTGKSQSSSYYGSAIYTDLQDFWNKARSVCQGIVDATFKSKSMGKGVRNLQKSLESSGEDDEHGDHDDSLQNHSGSPKVGKSKSSKKAFMTRKRPLYYNCQLLAPDGECLTLCDIRKAEWYITKELGVKISDDPFTVQLKFEPKSRPKSRKDYYLQDKENVCVVCGAEEDYVRKLVVPQEYRKYFPTILKDHSSHDVLLLCINCHLKCAEYEGFLRQRLVMECDAPLDSGKDAKRHLDTDLAKVVSAAKFLSSAKYVHLLEMQHTQQTYINRVTKLHYTRSTHRALQKSRDKIPAARVKELENIIKTFYGIQNIPDDLLEDAIGMETKIHNTDYVPHGKKVVNFYMEKHGGLLEFEKMWRRYFVENMEPKYLPPLWSVEHNPERLQPIHLGVDFLHGDCANNDDDDDDNDDDDDDYEDNYDDEKC